MTYLLSALALLVPSFAFAAQNLQGILVIVADLIKATIPIATAFALLAFIYGIAMYLFNFGEGKEDKQKQGRVIMFYGIIALFVVFTIAGIIAMLQYTFEIGGGPIRAPLPIPGTGTPGETSPAPALPPGFIQT